MRTSPKSQQSETFLVIGAQGDVGSRVLHSLQQAGLTARGAARNLPPAAKRARGEWVPFDLTWPATYERALRGTSRIFVCLPRVPEIPQWLRGFYAAAKEASVTRFVQVTSPGVRWHREAEEALQSSGLSHVLLRAPSRLQDFGLWHGDSIREHGYFTSHLGEARVAHVDTDDIAEAGVAALTRADLTQNLYTLTGPAAICDEEAAWILSIFTGRQISCREAGAPPEGCSREQLEFLRGGGARQLTPDLRALIDRPARPFAEYVTKQRTLFS